MVWVWRERSALPRQAREGSGEVPNKVQPLEHLIGELVKSGGDSIQVKPRRDAQEDRRSLGELKERIDGMRGTDGSLFVTGYFPSGDRSDFQLANERLVRAEVPPGRRKLFVSIESEEEGRSFMLVEMQYEFLYDATKGTLELGNFTKWHHHEE